MTGILNGGFPLERFPVERFPLKRFPVERFPVERHSFVLKKAENNKEYSSLYRILGLGGGPGSNSPVWGGGTFFIGESKNFAFLQTRKFSKNAKKSMKIL